MRLIRNRLLPFPGFSAINLFGILFVRPKARIDEELLNHEAIHSAQMRELLWVPFYVIYFLEWLVRLFKKGNAYRNISFEREAYRYQSDGNYVSRRHPFAQWRKNFK